MVYRRNLLVDVENETYHYIKNGLRYRIPLEYLSTYDNKMFAYFIFNHCARKE